MNEHSRIPALDYAKAAAIVAVAVTHAVPGFDDNWILRMDYMMVSALTSFHVPVFLFVAGFLSRTDGPAEWQRVLARLQRVVPPYLVATAVTWLIGWVRFPTVRKFVFKIVTGAALGHFYFIPVLTLCFLLLPFFSRATTLQLLVAAVVLMLFAEATWMVPAWRSSDMLFWQIRDPVMQFHVGHFLLGVCAGRHGRALSRIFHSYARPIGLATSLGIAAYVWVAASESWFVFHPAVRTGYSLAVLGVIAAFTTARATPPLVRFLSDTTLTVYLYHWFVYPPLKPLLQPFPLALRVVVLSGAGLAFGAAIAIGGRRLLGRRSRLLIGS